MLDKPLALCTAAKPPLFLEGLFLLQFCFGDLRTHLLIGITAYFYVYIFLSTALIDKIIRGIFPLKHKVFSWHSKPVATTNMLQLPKSDRKSP